LRTLGGKFDGASVRTQGRPPRTRRAWGGHPRTGFPPKAVRPGAHPTPAGTGRGPSSTAGARKKRSGPPCSPIEPTPRGHNRKPARYRGTNPRKTPGVGGGSAPQGGPDNRRVAAGRKGSEGERGGLVGLAGDVSPSAPRSLGTPGRGAPPDGRVRRGAGGGGGGGGGGLPGGPRGKKGVRFIFIRGGPRMASNRGERPVTGLFCLLGGAPGPKGVPRDTPARFRKVFLVALGTRQGPGGPPGRGRPTDPGRDFENARSGLGGRR